MDKPDRSQLEPAFILHHRPYSNSSLLVECFSASNGRFPAIAKSVRSRQSGGAGQLQPFNPLLIGWQGRGEVKSLRVFEQNGRAISLTGKAIYCGFYINELVMRLLQRGDPHVPLFHYYQQALVGLAASQSLEPVLRQFELKLLSELGYGLVLDREAEADRPIDPRQHYYYAIEQGPVVRQRDLGPGIMGSTLLALHHGLALEGEGLREARWLMRHVLGYYLGDRPLKSRELFRTLP
jgi:DNA repair protein RecO (recombination protein O)